MSGYRQPDVHRESGHDAPFDPSATPIWEEFEAVLAGTPEDELRRLPRDFAEQHDHYVYGSPKRTE